MFENSDIHRIYSKSLYKRFIKFVLIFLICINFILSSLYVFNNDIIYDGDIARDFLLLNEIKTKKIILLGPRSGAAPGLFHGPVWSYLNFPAFYLGNSNPIAVGWFWVILNGFFLLGCLFIAKHLFDPTSAYLFTLLISTRMIGFTRGFFNPSGAMLLVPLFLYLLIRYTRTSKMIYLVGHVLIGGLLIQLQVAIGAPFIITSFIYIIFRNVIHKKNPQHLLVYLLLLITFFTYFLFDFRHHFLMLNAVYRYLFTDHIKTLPSIVDQARENLQLLSGRALLFFREPYTKLNYIPFTVISLSFYFILLKKTNYRYWIFVYFYIGFYFLSLIQSGGLQLYYYFPLFPLIFLIFISLKHYIYPIIFYSLFLFVFIFNFKYEVDSLDKDLQHIGKWQMSWQFHNTIAQQIFNSAKNKEFGVFIYSPDINGYRSKYPLVYQQYLHPSKKMYIYEKKQETFVLLAGMPEYTLPWGADPDGYKRAIIKIKAPPAKRWSYNENYALEQFFLTSNEQNVPFDPTIKNWLQFR